jgi:hypothetical protein
MSVRQRKWMTTEGHSRQAWVCDCQDERGNRRLRTFRRRADAYAFASSLASPNKSDEGLEIADVANGLFAIVRAMSRIAGEAV